MSMILKDIKTTLGVDENNLGFDPELLIFLNSVRAELVQNGVSQLANLTIAANTEWPEFGNSEIASLVKSFMAMRVRLYFDPTASDTINRVFDGAATELVGRIAHEVDEVEDV